MTPDPHTILAIAVAFYVLAVACLSLALWKVLEAREILGQAQQLLDEVRDYSPRWTR